MGQIEEKYAHTHTHTHAQTHKHGKYSKKPSSGKVGKKIFIINEFFAIRPPVNFEGIPKKCFAFVPFFGGGLFKARLC